MDTRDVHETAPAQLEVENQRLQRALRARLEESEALRRVAMLLARQHEPEAVLALVTEEVAGHLDAAIAVTLRYDSGDHATVIASWTEPGIAPFKVGRRLGISPETALARVRDAGAPVRVDSYAGIAGPVPEIMRARRVRATVAAPIWMDGQLWGAFLAGSTDGPFSPDSEARLGAFTELVAQAIANVDAQIRLKESRARLVETADVARRRIERDLHDGAQQRLVALALSLRLVARSAEAGTAAAIERCIDELQAALAELRELARGLHPVVLTERGLPAALEMLAGRSHVPVALDIGLDRRLPPGHEAALYFVAVEALTNVAKYAGARTAELTLRAGDGWAEIAIADDGRGGACAENGSGLRGLGDRVEALGGRLTVTSATGEGTTVRARLPVGDEPG
ncbi:GAF domain-containing sensor histidine kinase [Solirubrobacter soli]|uniref:GAF domain-containing sensor histidine kinase n=1 Tax=Solirubrobacter soli TaxID=363832 RepID=UPI0003FABF28|nr:GAF domain-containing sensor histidine kinase [Solirubrobacter soli]